MTKRSLWASALCIVLYMAVSIPVTQRYPLYIHHLLVWNVFLAALPLVFAVLFSKCRSTLLRVTLGVLWLLFFPNAPYLVTDLIHITQLPLLAQGWTLTRDWYLWLVLMQLGVGLFLGTMLGACSLQIMHRQIRGWVGGFWAWAAVVGVCLAGGYGIYLGRFARVNSWDLLNLPLLLRRIFLVTDLHGLLISLGYAAYVLATYVVYHSFRNPDPEQGPTHAKAEKDRSW